ncbi:HAD family hydrolase [Candidatus Dojkabacteria bacterium]|nr:HAD family hydrolase [Candidatus Dojkabacteria bacterium]
MPTIFNKPYNFIIFDLDGTIINSLPLWLEIFNSVFERRNIKLTKEKIIEIAFYHNERLEDLEIIDTKAFWAEVREIAEERLIEATLFEGVTDLLINLKQNGIKLGIYTGTIKKAVNNVLQKYQLEEFFNLILTTDDVTNRKPHPEGILTACEKVNIPLNSSILIGDSMVDYQTAQNANIDFALFQPPENQPYILSTDLKILDKAEIIRFKSFKDLLKLNHQR